MSQSSEWDRKERSARIGRSQPDTLVDSLWTFSRCCPNCAPSEPRLRKRFSCWNGWPEVTGSAGGDRQNGCQLRVDGRPILSLERDEWLVRRPENAWPKRNAGGGRKSVRQKRKTHDNAERRANRLTATSIEPTGSNRCLAGIRTSQKGRHLRDR